MFYFSLLLFHIRIRLMKVLSVGASVIDLFLKPSDSHVKIDNGNVVLKLGDKVPTDIKDLTLGGNGANVAVGLSRLSHEVSFYTYLGTDALSKEIEQIAEAEKINLITDRSEQERTPLSLIFDFNDDRIIFSHHEKKNHIFSYKESVLPELIYLTSIGETWAQAYKDVLSFAKNNNIPIALSPGSAQLDSINDVLMEALKYSQYLFLNKEEGQKILTTCSRPAETIGQILTSLQALGPKIVSVTDGEKGAYAIDDEAYSINVFDHEKAIEKTGAGDSYATGFLASHLLRNPLPECMRWGGVNANSVTQFIGGQKGLLDKDSLVKALSERPDYQPKKLL